VPRAESLRITPFESEYDLPSHPVTPTWRKTMQWKRRLLLGALALIPIAPAVFWLYPLHRAGASSPPMSLQVSLSARELKVIQNGEVVQTYGVAVGRPSHPTPTGHFQTGDIDWNPAWRPPPEDWARDKTYQPPGSPDNPMQGVKIYFQAPYYFIHGTNNPDSIGEAASHGCIRMTSDDAVSLAHQIEQAGGSVPLVIEE
jgi:lipoprotein-anchoring transpeptidase ErfK/SrfK